MKYNTDRNRMKSQARHEQKRRDLAKNKFKRNRTFREQTVANFKRQWEEKEKEAFEKNKQEKRIVKQQVKLLNNRGK